MSLLLLGAGNAVDVAAGGGAVGTLLSLTNHSPGLVLASDQLGFTSIAGYAKASIDVGASAIKRKYEVQVFNASTGGLGGVQFGFADAAWIAAHMAADGSDFFVAFDAGQGSMALIGNIGLPMSDGEWASVMVNCDTGEIIIRTATGTSGTYGLGGAVGYVAPYFPVIRTNEAPQTTPMRVNLSAPWHYDDSAAGYVAGF